MAENLAADGAQMNTDEMRGRLYGMTAIILPLVLAVAFVPPPRTMKAVRIKEFGPASVMKLEEALTPTPGTGEMLVRVHAAAVNPIDWKIRSGGAGKPPLPYTPGFDVAGVVESVGDGVTKFKPGEAVFAMLDLRRGGAYAEYAVVKESEAATQPANITFNEAASVPLVALTAWQALFDAARLEKAQTILIHGGAGGVGSAAVQLAKWKGAKVIATASKDNHDYLKQLGADEAIDYRTEKFEDRAKDVDVVLDTVGGDTQARSFGVLKKGGILVSIVGRPSEELAKQRDVRGVGILVKPSADQLAVIAKLIGDGAFKPTVTHTFPLADAAKAHEQSESRHTRGKIVLEVVPERG
jgi:NADPH:quinone reductase-like Zn-dependent oxidoreductase